MKSPLQKMRKFMGTLFICISFKAAGMSMWNMFEQLEMHMRKSDDHKPMGMVHDVEGRFGNRSRAIFKSKLKCVGR